MPQVNYLNESISYSSVFSRIGTSANLSFMCNVMEGYNTGKQTGYGPNIGIQQSLLNRKMRLGLNAGFQDIHNNKQLLSRNLTTNFNLNYMLDKHQSIKCDLSYINRQPVLATVAGYSETRASLGYVYQFLIKKPKPVTQ